jgi:hypothetical protein
MPRSGCAQPRVNPQAGVATPVIATVWRSRTYGRRHANRTSCRATASTARCRPGHRRTRRPRQPGSEAEHGPKRGPRRGPELVVAALASRRVRRQRLGGQGARRPGPRRCHRISGGGRAGGTGHGVHHAARPARTGDVRQASPGGEGRVGKPQIIGHSGHRPASQSGPTCGGQCGQGYRDETP